MKPESGNRSIELAGRLKLLPAYPLAEIPAIKRRLLDAGVDVIDLGAGDNDRPPPSAVVEAMRDAVTDPAMSKYGFQQGLADYRRAARDFMERRFGHRFDAATEILPLIGSKDGLAHLPFAVTDPGDVVIVPEPGYQGYIGGAKLAGAEVFVYPLRAEQGFLVELDSLPHDVLQRARLVYANYPNNPTAAVADRAYLERLVGACRRYGIVLAYDNAYCDLTFDGYRAPSVFDVPGARDVALEFFSLSKSFSMTGWRIGFAVGRPELIAALQKVKTYMDTGPFLAVQRAAVVALDRSEELVEPIRRELAARRDAAVAALVAEGFGVDSPKAAMYLWVSLGLNRPVRDFTTAALEQEGVVVLAGSAFGPAGEGYFRIALTMGPDRLGEAVRRLGRVRSMMEGRVEVAGA